MHFFQSALSKTSTLLLGAASLTAIAAGCGGDEDGTLNLKGCPDDQAFFEANVLEPILEKQCFLCHNPNGLANKSRLVITPKSEAGSLEKNFAMVRVLAADQIGGTSVLLLRPAGKHPDGHPGGTLLTPGTPNYATLSLFVTRVTRAEGCSVPSQLCTASQPGPRVLRRLSRSEYDATLKDLLGISSTYGAAFVPDVVVDGFDNNADALRVSPLFADQLRRAAEEIAETTMKAPGNLVPCDPLNGNDACAKGFIETFGKKAFRRPLTQSDVDRYLALHQTISAKEGFAKGLEAVLAAILQSPHFLYRAELGDASVVTDKNRVKLSPYEIATELSYMLWGTMPDAELFAAADKGELSTTAQIETQAKRLLADPRSDAVLEKFASAWLDLDRLQNVPKDSATYPEWNDAIRAALKKETLAFLRHVIREGSGTLSELLNANYTYLSPNLAAFYGLPAPAGALNPDDFVMAPLDGTSRAGILSHGSILAVHAKPTSSSPVLRGRLVRERLLCQIVPPPPPGIVAEPPPVDPTKTTRERYAAHNTVELCKSCHQLMDPIGFGLENFDGIGRFRANDGAFPVDASGEIIASPTTDGAFSGLLPLASKLAESADVQSCFARQWIRYGYGQLDEGPLACLSNEVADAFEQGNLGLLDLLVSLTKTPHFTERIADPPDPNGGTTTGTTGAGGAGGASGTSSSAGGGGDPGPLSPVLVNTQVDSDWGTGYQLTVQITNISSAPLTWNIPLQVDGTIDNIWNADFMVSGVNTLFKGKDYNATLAPNQSTSFGFVATR